MAKSIDALAHIGITVSDLDRSVKFYSENFGMTYARGRTFEKEFFEAVKTLYRLEDVSCKIAVLDIPGGGQLELFEFSSQLSPEYVPWNRVGITHFAVITENFAEVEKQMRANGVEYCMDVGVRPDGGHWLFVRDPDGNMIEVMEPFK